MSTFNVTKRAIGRERLQFTNAGVTPLTASKYLPNLTAIEETTGGNAGVAQKIIAGAARIVLTAASGDLYFTEDGTDPTADTTSTGVGTLAGARDVIMLESLDAIKKFKGIAVTGVNVIAEVTYYR